MAELFELLVHSVNHPSVVHVNITVPSHGILSSSVLLLNQYLMRAYPAMSNAPRFTNVRLGM